MEATVSYVSAVGSIRRESNHNDTLYFDLFDRNYPCQRQFCHHPLFPREKEYSVKYIDGQVVNFTEYSFFPWKEDGDNTAADWNRWETT